MITIRKYQRADALAVTKLISETYLCFNSYEESERAVREYVESYSPKGKHTDDIHKRFSRTPNCFVALSGSRIVGVARGVENRLINLFVDGDYHRQGIATRLIHRFETACLQAGFCDIVLRSTLYATPFYESLGYKKTTGIRNFHGLRVQPMKKKLK